jgi:hypothetical protein
VTTPNEEGEAMIGLGGNEVVTFGALLCIAAAVAAIIALRKGGRAYWPLYLSLVGGALMFFAFSRQQQVLIGYVELLGILGFLVGVGVAGYTFTKPRRPSAS